jgi:uncharacterized protein affecting Mg2+/Co2+ transport
MRLLRVCILMMFFPLHQITMDESLSEMDACELVSRHWVITDENNNVKEVSGPGVIGINESFPIFNHYNSSGKFPIVRPGSFFEYESCSNMTTRTGKMGGHFTMRMLNGSGTFDALVPDFYFVAPTFVPVASQPARRSI